MAITSRLVGKFGGGAEVQKIPVNIVADGDSGSEVIMHTVHVPEGETWLVVLSGDLTARDTDRSGPEFFIGEDSIGPNLPEGRTSMVTEATGTAEIRLKRNVRYQSDTFSGQIYVSPLP